jgi:Na+-transporting NADH:ubiquinone oxidoreductase subunit C
MHSNRYTMIFALAVCVSCSVLLAIAAESLKPTIQRNMKFDIQRNILSATGLLEDVPTATREEIEKLYVDRIEGNVVDGDGKIVPGKTPESLDRKIDAALYPVYLRKDNGRITAYCLPIAGKGLWSTIYGYIALKEDATTVKGLTFYKHGETPGLGGEVEKEWFTKGFKDKTIFNSEGEFTPITVAKGKVLEALSADKKLHTVDGISGATLTGNGINFFLEEDLTKYLPYLKRIRSGMDNG